VGSLDYTAHFMNHSTTSLRPVTSAVAVAFLLLCAWAWPYTMEDAFISYRYAKHIGDGIGPIWNLVDGQRPVEGYTSFAHVWLLGALRLATRVELAIAAKLLGVLATLAVVASLAHEMARRGLGAPASCVGLGFALLPVTVLASVSGLETSLFMLCNWLCLVAGLRALEGSPSSPWLFALAGLAGTLTRPEFAAAFAGVTAFVWWRRPALRPRLSVAVLLLAVLPGLAITAWRWSFYGDLFPNPFYVKQGRSPNYWGVSYVAHFLLFWASGYGLIGLAGCRSLGNRNRDLLGLSALAVGVPCLYFTTVTPLGGDWSRFLVPQLPILAYCAAVSLPERSATGARRLGRAGALGVALMLVFSLVHLPAIVWFVPRHQAADVRFRELARRLRPFAAPDRWLAYKDVGLIPYESEWNTLDVVGLNTRREDLRSPCKMKPDLLLQWRWSAGKVPNPCPNLYVAIADLHFGVGQMISRGGSGDTYMGVLVRKDVSYARELQASLLEGFPEPFARPRGWLHWYWETFRFHLFPH